jgi:CubicO group peptidase (beta-lactamase class C family)
MSARDLARRGALVAQDGMWNQQKLVSTEWIAKSTTAYSATGASVYLISPEAQPAVAGSATA